MFQIAVAFTLLALTACSVLPRNQRIVGGSNSSIEEVPYQAAIERLYQTCGAVIVSKRHVVSGGDCFIDDSVNKLQVRIGSTLLETGGTTVRPSKIIHHPKYVLGNSDYDVAVVELEEDIEFSEKVQPIQLADIEPSEGTEVTISGWGSTESGGDPPKVLQIATTVVADRQKCQEQFGDSETITSRMLCGGGTEAGFCKGDGGGPVTMKTSSGDRVLVGIGSRVYKYCHQPGNFDVYVNVANPEILNFILDVTRM